MFYLDVKHVPIGSLVLLFIIPTVMGDCKESFFCYVHKKRKYVRNNVG